MVEKHSQALSRLPELLLEPIRLESIPCEMVVAIALAEMEDILALSCGESLAEQGHSKSYEMKLLGYGEPIGHGCWKMQHGKDRLVPLRL